MTTLKDKVYDALILDILQEMFGITPNEEERKEINELIDDALEPDGIEGEVN